MIYKANNLKENYNNLKINITEMELDPSREVHNHTCEHDKSKLPLKERITDMICEIDIVSRPGYAQF